MTVHDGISDIKIVEDGREASYSLEHLWDLVVTIPNFHFEDGRTDTVEVFVRPTNHVYSRALKPEEDREILRQTGRLIIRYEHHEDAPNKIKKGDDGNPVVSSDARAFCEEKYQSSLNIPDFVDALEAGPAKLCVLANRDDDRSCLTALFEFVHGPQQKECFVVIFKLHKLSARQLSMVIETAFLIDGDDFRVHLLNFKDKGKPFFVIANNVFANRKPFEGKAKKRAKKSYKKAKKKRQK